LKDLSIGYPMKKGTAKVVASEIDATIYSGQLTCLLGANGVGKSTLLRTLSAFQPALSGEIFIENTDIRMLNSKEMSKKISVVLTGKPDVMNITAAELVGLGPADTDHLSRRAHRLSRLPQQSGDDATAAPTCPRNGQNDFPFHTRPGTGFADRGHALDDEQNAGTEHRHAEGTRRTWHSEPIYRKKGHPL
jgi:ABC-type oligopeptide transport system ATPase subunit